MAHINIYVDDEMLEKVRTAAEIKHCSLSKFIRSQLEASLKQEDKWPDGYFEEVIGSLSDVDLERPPQPDFTAESRRAEL